MKKGLLLILGIVAVAFLIGNADYISNFVDTLQTGALVPLLVAIALMVARHIVQAQSYVAAFEAVGHHPTLRHEIVLIFSLVFINTFCLFSGATGVVFIVDDARRDGADAGTSTSGAFLSQIGYFAAVLVITVIGFVTMLLTGSVNTVFLVGGLALAGVLLGLSSLFLVGYYKPGLLRRFFALLERVLNKVMGVVKRSLKPDWAQVTALSFIENAQMLAKNPMGTFLTVAWASFSAILNMACLVAIGYAFDFEQIAPLMAAFALAAVSVIISPTPQGVGVVEAAIIMILTAGGCAVSTATAIALVYRGIMFWIPFCFGAIMLTQSGFFKTKKDATQEQKDKDTAWVSGVLVGVIGVVNIVINVASSLLQPYLMATQLVDLGPILPGWALIPGGLFLVLLAFGLIGRMRVAWAVTLTIMCLLAGANFLFAGTILPAVFMVGVAVWLFVKRDAFDQPLHLPHLRKRLEERSQDDPEIVDAARVVEGVMRDAEQFAAAQQVRQAGDSEASGDGADPR